MKKNFFLIKIILIYFLLCLGSESSDSNYFSEGKKLFDENKLEKSKILFERDLVFNPKSEKSYLYLAKIFDMKDNKTELEINLKNVLLLNPNNDEALYMMTLLKIHQSDFDQAQILIKKFNLTCSKFCSKKKEIENKFNESKP